MKATTLQKFSKTVEKNKEVHRCRDCKEIIGCGGGSSREIVKKMVPTSALASHEGYCLACFRKDPQRIEDAVHSIWQRTEIQAVKIKELQGRIAGTTTVVAGLVS